MGDSKYFKGGTGSHSKVDRGESRDGVQDYSTTGTRNTSNQAGAPMKNRQADGSWSSGVITTSAPKGPMHPK